MEKKSINLFSPLYFLLIIFFFFFYFTIITAVPNSYCNGSIAECNEEVEILMDSEISRRFLEQKKYISTGALKRDQPVCNGGNAGQPYSRSEGCLPPQSNPHYDRGCSTYYRCRHDA
ncbi:hypothetical protein M9H77_31171 [Catharanthus roseus]|uniref:Uncharacterized protein n=1 Tax=Catharanthus roseus TaxID=4058 RepID=A0ACC0A1E0_CATRO|nr:hypothetical protein M9H77_31171 [Catharanthus roseus]